MWHGRPIWAEIDLDAIRDNVAALKRSLSNGAELMAIVKANAYGHGAIQTARAALAGGATRLGVAAVDEGVELRRAGLNCPILVLGYIPPWEADKVVFHALTPTVNTKQLALALAAASRRRGTTTPVHVKVDTGLGRFGLLPGEALDFVRCLASIPHLQLEGLWTHFATADEADKAFFNQQLETYMLTLRRLEEAGYRFSLRHTANSGATLDSPEAHLDCVRPGIAIYGLYPSNEVRHDVKLRPAMTLKSRVARVRRFPAGAAFGYGRSCIADHPVTAALVPGGYADGVRRSLSNQGEVLVRGRRARILGRVSMDQIIVDVTGIPDVAQDDEVVLLGRQGEEEITADEVAAKAGTINYDVVTGVPHRVPRVYLHEGEVVDVETMVDDGPPGFHWLAGV